MATDTEPTTTEPTGEAPDTLPENIEVVVTGHGQLSLDMGGNKQPTSSKLTVTGGKFTVEGEFKLGDRLSLALLGPDGEQLAKAPVVVDEVSAKQYIDGKTGDVTDVERRHKARVQK